MERNKVNIKKNKTPEMLADRFPYFWFMKMFNVILEYSWEIIHRSEVFVLIIYLEENLNNLACKIKSDICTGANDSSIIILAC